MAAITTLLPRAASSAAPLAIRILARRQYYHSPLFRPLALGNRLSPELRGGSPFPSHPFSSFRYRHLGPSTLLNIIDAKFKYAKLKNRNDEIPNQFSFKIVDEPGTEAITLTRDYNGQHIEVSISIQFDEDTYDQSGIQLVVKIYEEDAYGLSLEFYCTAYADELTIDKMYVLRRGGMETFDFFSNLDEAYMKTYHKYLEFIGISPRTTNFLHEYMIDKDCREDLIKLKELRDFIQKWELKD